MLFSVDPKRSSSLVSHINQNFTGIKPVTYTKFLSLKSFVNQHLSEKTYGMTSHVESHMWLDCKGLGWGVRKKNAFYIQLETAVHIWAGKLLCACVSLRACMRACLWMCVSVYVWVCACIFSISPWATPTHSHVSHSMSEKGSSQAK